jgi:hypothetical protein
MSGKYFGEDGSPLIGDRTNLMFGCGTATDI